MRFIAVKTDDGRIKGEISFFCQMLHVSREGFRKYLINRDKPWKYEGLAEEMKSICSEDECNDQYGRERVYQALRLKHEGDSDYHYRLDRMTCVKILVEKVKEQREVRGLEKSLNLPKHMAEHIYMFGGDSIRVRMRVETHLMTEMVDWFGKDFRISDEKSGLMTVLLIINESAMFYWALQYGPYVEVLEPESLRNKIAEAVARMYQKYKE